MAGGQAVAAAKARFPEDDRVLVAYSGGKDSVATVDLCVRAGKSVEAFFMYFIPGLDYTEHWCAWAEKQWNIKVHRVQHWNTSYYLRRGVFMLADRMIVQKLTILDIESHVRQATGIEWIGYGYKSIDSLQRRGMMNKWDGGLDRKRKIFTPIKDWNDTDVKAYLSARHLPNGSLSGKRSTGIDLTAASLRYMRDNWPADYRRILSVFPLAAAQIDRQEYYGQKSA